MCIDGIVGAVWDRSTRKGVRSFLASLVVSNGRLAENVAQFVGRLLLSRLLSKYTSMLRRNPIETQLTSFLLFWELGLEFCLSNFQI
jgi:hypothetical protein